VNKIFHNWHRRGLINLGKGSITIHNVEAIERGDASVVADAVCYPGSDRGRFLCPRRLSGVERPVTLFNAASALVSGNGGADVVWANPLARCGDLLLRLARCQRKDPIIESRRRALAASGFCGRGAPAPAGSCWSRRLRRRSPHFC